MDQYWTEEEITLAEGPYKTWIGLRFFHERKNDVHAPSFYVHISSHGSYMGGGLWRPQPATLRQVREFLVNNPQTFRNAGKALEKEGYTCSGEKISRLPRGYEEYKDIQEELKMKSFTWNKMLSDQTVSSQKLHDTIAQHFKDLAPMVDYLCAGLNLDF